jgi:hypothetical protein
MSLLVFAHHPRQREHLRQILHSLTINHPIQQSLRQTATPLLFTPLGMWATGSPVGIEACIAQASDRCLYQDSTVFCVTSRLTRQPCFGPRRVTKFFRRFNIQYLNLVTVLIKKPLQNLLTLLLLEMTYAAVHPFEGYHVYSGGDHSRDHDHIFRECASFPNPSR